MRLRGVREGRGRVENGDGGELSEGKYGVGDGPTE